MIPIVLSLVAALSIPPGTLPATAVQAPSAPGPSAPPPFVQQIEPAVVGIQVAVPLDRPSVLTLGPVRWGSGVIFDRTGYVLTVSYVVIDAEIIQVLLRDGRKVPAKLVGLDLEDGLAVVKLEGDGPWPAAPLGDSSKASVGMSTATIGVDDDNDLSFTGGSIQEIRNFVGYWEYMLNRAFVVAPPNPAFGGSALVNGQGEVIGIVSFRIGERQGPFSNVAIPIELFLPVKDELIAKGRVESRGPRPWLGLYTVPTSEGLIVAGASPNGPAGDAGFQRGDVILRVNGDKLESQEDFYRKLWQSQIGQEMAFLVMRESRFEVIKVRPVDRYQLFRSKGK